MYSEGFSMLPFCLAFSPPVYSPYPSVPMAVGFRKGGIMLGFAYTKGKR